MTPRKLDPKTKNQPRPVIVFGVRYQSTAAAARALKCARCVIQNWCSSTKRVAGRAHYAA